MTSRIPRVALRRAGIHRAALRRTALGASLLLLGPSCDEDVSEACLDLGDESVDQNIATIETFVDSAVVLLNDVNALALEVDATCQAMANDLGLTVPALPIDCASDEECPGASTCGADGLCSATRLEEASCGVVADEIEAILSALDATLTFTYAPPQCSVTVDGYAGCVADCDISVDASAEVECMEGRLVGQCSGTCTGECRVEGSASCTGSCSGTCTGSCSGICQGSCDGTCEAVDGAGNCVGRCDGTCNGSCSASCEGSCSGTCTAEVEAACQGECAGRCDVDFQAPRCEGQAMIDANVDCEAVCRARLDVEAECTPPVLEITYDSGLNLAEEERLAALLGTLYTNYPRFLALLQRLRNVAESGAAFVDSAQGVRMAARELGLVASACALDAVNAAVAATATVSVSVSVSVEVSASAGDSNVQ